jgi:hypothetical protein
MTILVRQLLEQGHANLAKQKAEKEEKLRGHLRVGTSGCVVGNEIYGTCHRIALARSLGIEEKAKLHTRVMWYEGEYNEVDWDGIITASTDSKTGKGHYPVDRNQTDIKATIEGVPLPVLGHPDMLLAKEMGGEPILGLELKGVFGYSTAVLVSVEGKPKCDNLIQAAAYAHFLNLPYELWYTNSCYWPKMYGKEGIEPFYKGFALDWREGILWYQPEEKEWVETLITVQGIKDYYRFVAEMPTRKELGPRVTSNYADGSPNKWGPQANCKFCAFSSSCDRYDTTQDYDKWIEDIKTAVEIE